MAATSHDYWLVFLTPSVWKRLFVCSTGLVSAVTASPAEQAFMRTIALAAAALAAHDLEWQLAKNVLVRDRRRSRLGTIVQKEESH